MASAAADGAPQIAPDIAENAAMLESAEAMRLAADIPSSDDDAAAETTAEAVSKEPMNTEEIIRKMEQRMAQMEYEHRAAHRELE